MYLRDFFLTLLRHKVLAVLAVVATIGITLGVASKVDPTYSVQASYVMVPPETTVNPPPAPGEQRTRGNPYLFLGGLEEPLDVLIRYLDSAESRDRVESSTGLPATYEVTPDWTTSAPILVLTAEGSTEEAATRLLTGVMADVPVALADLQNDLDVPDGSQITSQVVTRSEAPEADQALRYRVLAVAAFGSLLLFGLLIAAYDGIRGGRVGRRDAGPPSGTSTDEPPPEPINESMDESAPQPDEPLVSPASSRG